jgi:hypothetical protein
MMSFMRADVLDVPLGSERIYNDQLSGLDQVGRSCEVCDGHVPMHRWADMDVNGFITNCPFKGYKWEV